MAVACAGLFVYGLLNALLGAALPGLRLQFDLGWERSGLLFSVLHVSQVPTVFLAGAFVDRYGKKPMLVAGPLLCAIALAAIPYAGNYAVLSCLLFLLGAGGSFISSGANTLVTDLYPKDPSSALNIGHTFFGLGAVSFPLLVALFAAPFGLPLTFCLAALLVAGIAAAASLQSFPASCAVPRIVWRDMTRAALDPAVILLAWIVFLNTALLASLAGWLRVYLEQDWHTSAWASSLVLTLFWSLVALGRLSASRLVRRVRGSTLVIWACGGMVLGLGLVVGAPDARFATVGLLLCGLSYGPIYPTTVGSAGTYFPRLFGTVFGTLQAAGLAGGMVVPAMFGFVARASSLAAGMKLLSVSALLLLASQAVFVIYERSRFLRSGSQIPAHQ